MLNQMNFTTEGINRAAAFMTSENATAKNTAIWYLINYKAIWQIWMPQEVSEKIEQAIDKLN